MSDFLNYIADMNTTYVWLHIMWLCIMAVIISVIFAYQWRDEKRDKASPMMDIESAKPLNAMFLAEEHS